MFRLGCQLGYPILTFSTQKLLATEKLIKQEVGKQFTPCPTKRMDSLFSFSSQSFLCLVGQGQRSSKFQLGDSVIFGMVASGYEVLLEQ
ncbi:hypothetical protein Lepto7376_3778 [[Leptolyngbya] sp. PCC 7376]|nr:hypothetical protein Lepto7376_3778 [[Leptolyngbya] sp. PCC 7376]